MQRLKTEGPNWKTVFAIHKIRKGSVYKIGKQLLYISEKKKTNNPVKMGKTSKQTF